MSLGMPEIMIIMVIALIVFGPRKLPELGKSIGQALAQFRRASDDFKRTWEQEVEIEKTRTQVSSNSTETTISETSDSTQTTDGPFNPDGSYNYGTEPESGYGSSYEYWANNSGASDAAANNADMQAADITSSSETSADTVPASARETTARPPAEKSWI